MNKNHINNKQKAKMKKPTNLMNNWATKSVVASALVAGLGLTGAGQEVQEASASSTQQWIYSQSGMNASAFIQLNDGSFIISTQYEANEIHKISPTGSLVWSKKVGGNGTDMIRGLTPTADGGFVATGQSTSTNLGYTHQGWYSAFVAKFDTNGNKQWVKGVPTTNENYGISTYWAGTETTDGGIIVTGFSQGYENLKTVGDSADYIIAKYDRNGNRLWIKKDGGTSDEYGYEITATKDNGAIVFASTDGTFPGLVNKGERDIVAFKIDANGNRTNLVSIGGNGSDQILDAVATSDGGSILVGETASSNFGTPVSGSKDGFVVKLDASGNQQWTKRMGGANTDSLVGVVQTSDGGYVVSGYRDATFNPQTYASTKAKSSFIAKLDPSGNQLWEKTFDGNGLDEFLALVKTNDKGFATLGFSNSTDIPGFSNAGGYQTVLVKYSGEDVKPPTITLSPNTTIPTNQSVTVNANITDEGSVVQKKWSKGVQPVGYFSTGGTALGNSFIADDNGVYTVYAIDGAGNSTVQTITISNIDKIAPDSPKLVSNNTNATNKDVLVDITYPSDASVKQYKIGATGEWKTYTSSVVVSENAIVFARSSDLAGNISVENSLSITNIDKIAPGLASITKDTLSPTNKEIKVSITFPADASVKQYKIGKDGAWTVYADALVLDTNNTVYARSADAVGNLSGEATLVVENIDKVAPLTPTFTIDPLKNTVAFDNLVDTDSGIDKVLYRINGETWTEYDKAFTLPDGVYNFEVKTFDKAGNVSAVATNTSTFMKEKTDAFKDTVKDLENASSPTQNELDNAKNDVNKLIDSPGKEELLKRLEELQHQLDATLAVEKAEASDNLVDLESVQDLVNKVGNPVKKSELQDRLDKQKAYLDVLAQAEVVVSKAEKDKTRESFEDAKSQLNSLGSLEVDEKADFEIRLDKIKTYLDAKEALEKALNSKEEKDIQDAKNKIDLLDKSNPIFIDIIEDIEKEFVDLEMLSLVYKERFDLLSSKYGMSRVAYDSMVQSYYAFKYTGDFMYARAGEKLTLVPTTDKHYDLAQSQYKSLKDRYNEFRNERIQTQAEIQATSAVKIYEGTNTSYNETKAQDLINAVEDKVIRADLQKRFDDAKVKHEENKVTKDSQNAITSVEKAESTKLAYYVTSAYKLVDALTDETLKASLTERLVAVETQIELDKIVSSATESVENAERYKSATFITTAQNKVNALLDGQVKTALQLRLDNLNAGNPVTDQSLLVTKAKNALSLAQSLKTKTYVDKAQTAIDLVEDATVKAELQAKLDAIVVK